MERTPSRGLMEMLARPLFLVLDTSGLILLFASSWLPAGWSGACTIIGSTFLTIGLTLPVGLFFQMQSNAEAFKILNTCSKFGIESIFASRKHDSIALRAAIDQAVSESASLFLLGVAFRTFFDPSAESTDIVRTKLNSPSTVLRALLLDPGCNAATTRADVELGNATIDDINYTLKNSLVATAQERLRHLLRNQPSIVSELAVAAGDDGARQNLLVRLKRELQLEVRTYSTEPVAFVMMCDNTMFTEQYHRGRPEEIVPIGSCIGKYMPMIQYRAGSIGYRFLQCHCEIVWADAKDLTTGVLAAAIDRELQYTSRRRGDEGAPRRTYATD